MPRTTTACDSAPATGRLPACAPKWGVPPRGACPRPFRCSRLAVSYPAPMAAPRIDFAAEGLLDGLEGEARAERLALLEQLAGEGVALSELRRTTASGT